MVFNYQTYPGMRANVRTSCKIGLQINVCSQVYHVITKSLTMLVSIVYY